MGQPGCQEYRKSLAFTGYGPKQTGKQGTGVRRQSSLYTACQHVEMVSVHSLQACGNGVCTQLASMWKWCLYTACKHVEMGLYTACKHVEMGLYTACKLVELVSVNAQGVFHYVIDCLNMMKA